MTTPYIGRFAPSPSGPLHAGSVVAALASYLDARAHRGQWHVRIEDVDTPRTVPGAADIILAQLAALGMRPDGEVWWQSQRFAIYDAVLDRLKADGLVYGCSCTRRELAAARAGLSGPTDDPPYPGTCRAGLAPGRSARAWRLRVAPGVVQFQDRWQGWQSQDVAQAVGDFVLRRADGLWAYQLAVVVDDIAQGVTHVVRGQDLLSSTARQIHLRAVLARHAGSMAGVWPSPPGEQTQALPAFLHVPVLCAADGRKLSKQNGAPAVDTTRPLAALQQAWQQLGFDALAVHDVTAFHEAALTPWRRRFGPA